VKNSKLKCLGQSRLVLLKKKLSDDFSPDLKASLIKLWALKCDTEGCKNSIRYISETMNVGKITESAVSMIPAITELFTDQSIYPALDTLAKNVQEKVDRTQARETMETGDVFTDVQNALIVNGKEKDEAFDLAIKIMGVIGTRGAAADGIYDLAPIARTTLGSEYAKSIANLGVIASSMNYLDKHSPKGRPYSLPKEVTTTCDYVRPYHFWMTAYLGHTLKNKASKDDLNKASQIMIRAYEKWGTVKTNSWEKMGHKFYEIETLKDITYHDIGMKFGIDPKGLPQLQLENSLKGAFEAMEKERQNPPPSLVEKLKNIIKN